LLETGYKDSIENHEALILFLD